MQSEFDEKAFAGTGRRAFATGRAGAKPLWERIAHPGRAMLNYGGVFEQGRQGPFVQGNTGAS
jgi:hypothetical protein